MINAYKQNALNEVKIWQKKMLKKPSLFNALSKKIQTKIAEQNGFVYIIYVNKNGETTKGWINKKDLQPVQ